MLFKKIGYTPADLFELYLHTYVELIKIIRTISIPPQIILSRNLFRYNTQLNLTIFKIYLEYFSCFAVRFTSMPIFGNLLLLVSISSFRETHVYPILLFIEDARAKFKRFVNQLATTKTEGSEKFLILRPKYNQNEDLLQSPSPSPLSPHHDSRSAIGLQPASSPVLSFSDFSPVNSPVPRQPPPYRPPPPVTPTSSSDNISISSSNYSLHSASDLDNPYAPPRKKFSEKKLEAELKALENDNSDSGNGEIADNDGKEVEKQSISVKERLQKFNKMASADDELSPRQKDKKKQPETVSHFYFDYFSGTY